MKSITISMNIMILLIGIGIGYSIAPEYQIGMSKKQSGMTELGTSDRWLDLRFIDGMISHHLTAIDLAKQATQNSSRKEITELAQNIIAGDEASIKELYGWKRDWYKNNRQITKFTKINLGEKDENFDLRFLNALIAHHEEAIMVTSEVQTKSSNNQVLTLASQVRTSLQDGVKTFESWRKSWYQL